MTNKLEKARQDKIRSLYMINSKKYLDNLNLKMFYSNTKGMEGDYDEQLVEIFGLTEDKMDNLELFSRDIDLYSINPNLLVFVLKCEISMLSYTSLALNNGIITLKSDMETLKSLLLEDDIEFNIHSAICQIIQNMSFTIQSLSHFVELHDEKFMDEELVNAETEKDFIIGMANENEGIRLLKDSDYLDLIDTYVMVLNSLKEIVFDFRMVNSEVISAINDYLINR